MRNHGHECDTIVASATAPGRAAIAIVRLSGPAAEAIAGKLARVARGRWPPAPRTATLADVVDGQDAVLDRGLVTVFPAPSSYTGETVVELSLHGSPAVVHQVVERCIALGARPAEPGEFTMRALRAGKLDLTQAEAVADLIESATVEQARVAARQLRGEVADALGPLSQRALDLLADAEAALDFGDGEHDLADPTARLAERARALAQELSRLATESESSRRVREGMRVVLLGPPNAGKSSLFNALLGTARAIVTDEPGTTRDLVEEWCVIAGQPVLLIDSAGVGEARGAADAMGMERAREAAADADLVLRVFDASRFRQPGVEEGDVPTIIVGTHADLLDGGSGSDRGPAVFVSSTSGAGIQSLIESMARKLDAPGGRRVESVVLASARHRHHAQRARDALLRSVETLGGSGAPELAAVELREAVGALREILGDVGTEDVLGRIFSRFCIGK